MVTLKKQPHRHSSKKHVDAIKKEVIKLKRAGAIKVGLLPKVAGQYSCGEEEVRKVESLRRFYQLE